MGKAGAETQVGSSPLRSMDTPLEGIKESVAVGSFVMVGAMEKDGGLVPLAIVGDAEDSGKAGLFRL